MEIHAKVNGAYWFNTRRYRLGRRSFQRLFSRVHALKWQQFREIFPAISKRGARISFLLVAALTLNACDKPAAPAHSLEVAVSGVYSGAISQSGEYALVGSLYHGGSLWRLPDNSRLFNWNHDNAEPSTLVASDFSDDGKWALTATVNTLVLWNTQSGESVRFWAAPGEILDVRLGPQARTALLGLADHTAVLFDIQRGGIVQTFSHRNRVRSVDLSANGMFALTGSEDYSAVLWDVQSGEALQRIIHNDDVQLVRLSPDGQLALSMGKYDKALVWATQTGEAVGEVPLAAEHLKRGLRFTAARFSADSQQLLTGRPDQWVELWSIEPPLTRLEGWELPKRDAWKPTSASVIDVAFTTENSIRAIASNGFIHTLTRNKNPGQ